MQSVLRPIRQLSAGFTLIEVGLASIVSAIMMASALLFIADYLQGQRAQALGESLFALNQAVNSYETRFSVQLANNQPVSIPGYANVVNSYAPTTTELFELGLLPNQTPQGSYGIKINSTLSAGTPTGLVWMSQPFVNRAGEVDQSLAGLAMTAAGGDAGMSTVSNPTQIVGADNWSATNPVGTQPGILAMRNGAGSGAYLRLDGSTPMQGSINMNNNNVTGANSVSTSTLTASTATTGTLTATTATATTLSATNTTTGTLTANSTNTGTLTASSNISAGGSFTAAGAIYAGTGITTAGDLQAAGNVQASGSLEGAQVVPTGTAQAGWGCSPSGAILRDPSGNLLSCVNGVWTTPNAQDIINLSNSITNLSNSLSNTINGNTANLQNQVNGLSGSIAGLQSQIASLASNSSGNLGAHGGVVNITAGEVSGAPCGGFIVYYADGTGQVLMPWAGCSWN